MQPLRTRQVGAAKKNPRPRPGVVWPPRAPPDAAFWTIYCPRGENPNPRRISRNTTPSSAAIEDKFGGQSLCSGTLPGRGSAPGAISIDSIAITIAVADSHDEEGVVLPRG